MRDHHIRCAMQRLHGKSCAFSWVLHTLSQALGLSAGGVADPPRQPLELWVADAATGAARCLLRSPELGLNAVFDECAPIMQLPLSPCCMQRVGTIYSWALGPRLTSVPCKIRPSLFAPLYAEGCWWHCLLRCCCSGSL